MYMNQHRFVDPHASFPYKWQEHNVKALRLDLCPWTDLLNSRMLTSIIPDSLKGSVYTTVRCSFDGMVGVAVIVDENLFRALPFGYRYLGCFGGAETRRDILRCSLDSNRALALALESLMEERSLVQFIKIVLRERSGGVYDEPQWIVGAWM
jgi:hypothetical protein